MRFFDIHHHFYKIAKDLMTDPQDFYSVMNLDPNNSRISLFAVSIGVILPYDVIMEIEDKMGARVASHLGVTFGKSLVRHVMNEYGFELSKVAKKKLFLLFLDMLYIFGFGCLKAKKLDLKAGKLCILGKRVISGNKRTYYFVSGILSGIYAEVTGKEIKIVANYNPKRDIVMFSTD